MPSLDLEHELVTATDLLHNALRLARWRNVIGQSNHVEQIGTNAAQIDPLPTDQQLIVDEPVLLVEVLDNLPKEPPGHRNEIIQPGLHGVPGLDDLWIVQVVPQVQIRTDIVLDRLECFGAVIKQLTWNNAQGVGDLVGIEGLVDPADESARLLVRKIQGSRQQDKVPETIVGP